MLLFRRLFRGCFIFVVVFGFVFENRRGFKVGIGDVVGEVLRIRRTEFFFYFLCVFVFGLVLG